MDGPSSGQPTNVAVHVSALPGAVSSASEVDADVDEGDRLCAVYREHVDFVWRVTRRLGVPDAAVDDVVHDVFLIVQRRLDDYDARFSMRSWLVGITRRVCKDYFRSRDRARARLRLVPGRPTEPTPEDAAARTEAADFVRSFLDRLDVDQRMVFMLADVEGMTVPEIARALRAKVPTVYSRLRLARQKFERELTRLRAQQRRGS